MYEAHSPQNHSSPPVRNQASQQQQPLPWPSFLPNSDTPAAQQNHIPPGLYRGEADRKRRHAGIEHERRQFPALLNRLAGPAARMADNSQQQLGTTRDTAIDLTSPQISAVPHPPAFVTPQRPNTLDTPSYTRPPHPGNPFNAPFGLRSPDAPLPPWQPDADVSECPVCHTDFTFWYRKHHCRKCGRVVCASCSPHRITIPRQYIVQPPSQFPGQDEEGDDATGDGISAFFGLPSNPALGGGEVVRVCNPCVPDPWTPDRPQPGQPTPTGVQRSRSLRNPPTHWQQPQGGSGVSGALPWPDRRESAYARQRAYSSNPATTANRDNNGPPALNPFTHPHFQGPHAQSVQQSRPRVSSHRYTHSYGSHPLPPLPYNPGRLRGPGAQPVPEPPRPRREVKEEDECPVCGVELPPGDEIREAHIQDCIANRFSSTPRERSIPVPTAAAAVDVHSADADATVIASSSSASPPAAPGAPGRRASVYRPRGMALSRATEKDCTTEDGEPQECIICFEEFQPGDELGRMECLCKFHRACIRQWWDTKGMGSCPTHQLHE